MSGGWRTRRTGPSVSVSLNLARVTPLRRSPGLLYAADAEIDMLYRRLMEVADRLSVLA